MWHLACNEGGHAGQPPVDPKEMPMTALTQIHTERTTSKSVRPLRRSAVREMPEGGKVARHEVDEVSLVARLIADDADAWRTFTRTYTGLIVSVIRRVMARFTRVMSEQDVDEIYARFCLELLAQDKKKLRLYSPEKGSRFSTWLGLLATNATYDYLRRMRRHQGNEPMPERDTFVSDSPSAFELVALEEQAQVAAQFLGELSERDREFVELYFAEGLEPEEISRKMGISVKTVYTKKHKITARLGGIVGRACEA
jgi:RNA polymerase sigma-70 factor, ECF subfamily